MKEVAHPTLDSPLATATLTPAVNWVQVIGVTSQSLYEVKVEQRAEQSVVFGFTEAVGIEAELEVAVPVRKADVEFAATTGLLLVAALLAEPVPVREADVEFAETTGLLLIAALLAEPVGNTDVEFAETTGPGPVLTTALLADPVGKTDVELADTTGPGPVLTTALLTEALPVPVRKPEEIYPLGAVTMSEEADPVGYAGAVPFPANV